MKNLCKIRNDNSLLGNDGDFKFIKNDNKNLIEFERYDNKK